jgi:multidrug efflux pump subunit AcrA (membrane-fusion protein)
MKLPSLWPAAFFAGGILLSGKLAGFGHGTPIWFVITPGLVLLLAFLFLHFNFIRTAALFGACAWLSLGFAASKLESTAVPRNPVSNIIESGKLDSTVPLRWQGRLRTDPLRLRLSVPEREAEGLTVGLPVRLSVGEAPENAMGESPAAAQASENADDAGATIPRGIEGRIARLGPSITEASRTLEIEVEVPNFDGALRPGSFARAEIVVRAADPAVLVPASAVVSFAGVDKVIGVAQGKAVEKRVRLGRKSGDQIEIVSGLAAGESVVVSPGNLTEGQAVEVAAE